MPNMGILDRILRVIIALFMIINALVYGRKWGYLGFILLGTAIIGWCPAYRIFGISTVALNKLYASQTRIDK